MNRGLNQILLPSAPQSDQLDLSIVVMFTHDADQAERCLRGIASIAATQVRAETIVVLNACSSEVRDLIERTAGARVIDSPVNTGTVVGWQLAFCAARADRVLLLHEDAVATSQLAEQLIATLDSDPTAAVVGPWLAEDDGPEPTNAGWITWRDQSQTALSPADIPPEYCSGPYAVDYVSSAISLWDRPAWLEIGGFDEKRFPAVGVEVDACTALIASGRCVLADPAAIGLHRRGAMDSAPGPLSGPRLRFFLFDQHVRDWAHKWGSLQSWKVDLAAHGWPQPAAAEAIEAGLASAQARRSEQRRMPPPLPLPDHGLTNPDSASPAPIAVDKAMAERLAAAERKIIDDYCRWLIDSEDAAHAREDAALKRELALREQSDAMWHENTRLWQHNTELQSRLAELEQTRRSAR